MIDALLISTYALGHQPFGLASPAAWLKSAGAEVACLDLSVQSLDEDLVRRSRLIAVYLPMHTATRLAAAILPRLRALNPRAHLCCYGLYATTNGAYLRELGVDTVLGGEFESTLVDLYHRLDAPDAGTEPLLDTSGEVSLSRQQFVVPDRSDLPPLGDYARLLRPDGTESLVGYTEASRGCKHRCRHCPIVPVYNGRFRIVQPDIVLADIRQQVAAGAEHVTFGDPDFLNGPGHTMPIVHALHREYPDLTYDVTIKVEHLLEYDHLLSELVETGCVLITSAVESVDDGILERLDKGHTQADFMKAATRLRQLNLALNPTFVPFTPWSTARGYLDMLAVIRDLGMVASMTPIQYAIRLLIPEGSRLLELADVRELVGPFDRSALSYPWRHPESAMDRLYERLFRLVQENQKNGESRELLFTRVWAAAAELLPGYDPVLTAGEGWEMAATPIPHLSESWY